MDDARNRLAAEAQKREEKIRAIKDMIEAEKQKFVARINERLETMIRRVVVTKVKERVRAQASFEVEVQLELPLTLFQRWRSLCSLTRRSFKGTKVVLCEINCSSVTCKRTSSLVARS